MSAENGSGQPRRGGLSQPRPPAWVAKSPPDQALKGRPLYSVPDVSLVVFHPLFPKKLPILFLKTHNPVMLLLSFDVRCDGIHRGGAHRKRDVAVAPMN